MKRWRDLDVWVKMAAIVSPPTAILVAVFTTVVPLMHSEDRGVSTASREPIVIDPSNWWKAEWDESGPVNWRDPDRGFFTHTHAFGRAVGHFTYKFSLPQAPISPGMLSARLSSEFDANSPPSKNPAGSNGSDVTLIVNDHSYPAKEVVPDNGSGQLYEWGVPTEYLRFGENTVTFSVLPNASQRNGLCIYYKAVRSIYKDAPITLKFKS